MGPSGNRRPHACYSKSWYAERSLPARPAGLRPIGYRIELTGGFSGQRAVHVFSPGNRLRCGGFAAVHHEGFDNLTEGG